MTGNQQIFLTVVLSLVATVGTVAAIILCIVVVEERDVGHRLSWVPAIVTAVVVVACLVALYFIVGAHPVPAAPSVAG